MPVRKKDNADSSETDSGRDESNSADSDRVYGAGLPTDPFADLTIDVEDFVELEESTDPGRRRQAIEDFGGSTNPGMGVDTSDLSEARKGFTRASQRLDGVIAEMKRGKSGYEARPGTAKIARIKAPQRAKMTAEYPARDKLAPRHADVQKIGYVEGEPAEKLNIAVVVGPSELYATRIKREFNARQQKHNVQLYKWDGFALDLLAFEATEYPNMSPDIIMVSDALHDGDLGSSLETSVVELRKKFKPTYFVAMYFDPSRAELKNHPFKKLEKIAGVKFDGFFHQHIIGNIGQDELTSILLAYVKSPQCDDEKMVFGKNKDKRLIEVPKGILYSK